MALRRIIGDIIQVPNKLSLEACPRNKEVWDQSAGGSEQTEGLIGLKPELDPSLQGIITPPSVQALQEQGSPQPRPDPWVSVSRAQGRGSSSRQPHGLVWGRVRHTDLLSIRTLHTGTGMKNSQKYD